jgi:hypothetical protein
MLHSDGTGCGAHCRIEQDDSGGNAKQKEGGMPCGIAGQAAGAGQPVDKRLHMYGWTYVLVCSIATASRSSSACLERPQSRPCRLVPESLWDAADEQLLEGNCLQVS